LRTAFQVIKNVDFYKQEKPYLAIVKDGAGVGRVTLLPERSSVIGTMQYILPNENVDAGFLYYVLVSMKLARILAARLFRIFTSRTTKRNGFLSRPSPNSAKSHPFLTR
jgi:hypothetical protein